MKNIFLILILIFVVRCDYENPVIFTYYNKQDEHSTQLLVNSFNKFNSLVNCKAVEINILEETKEAEINNKITEIEFTNNEKIQSTMTELDKPIVYDKIAGLTVAGDADIFLLEDNAFEFCVKKELNDCIYNRLDIIVFHELGHVFGLSHVDNKQDVMYETCLSNEDEFDFKSFVNRLHKQTNMCKVIYE